MPLKPQFELLLLLRRHGVPFVVVGGHAVTFHGHVRSTEDVNVVWLRSPDAEVALTAALREANAAWISAEIDPATLAERLMPVTEAYVRGNHLMMLFTDFGFLNVFDYVPGYPHADVAEFFAESVLHGDLRYASLAWLRRMKAAAGRPKDNDDLSKLAD